MEGKCSILAVTWGIWALPDMYALCPQALGQLGILIRQSPHTRVTTITYICNMIMYNVTAIALVVEVAPVIDVEVTNQTLNQGDMAFFSCQATGQPIPIISWYFNDALVETINTMKYMISETSLNSTIKYSTLTITDAKLSDIGTYTCNAANVVSSNTSSGMLAVNGKFIGWLL